MDRDQETVMPKNKDLKRLVRERMGKTGESYTAALAQLLAKRTHDEEPLPESQLAELAGMSTRAVHKATGHDWSWWLNRLDGAGFRRSAHREITLYLDQGFELSGWWIQSVAVGFERMVGLREIGQRRDKSYDANKSKTFPVPVEELYRCFTEVGVRQSWLAESSWRVRTQIPNRSIRLDWDDDKPVALWFTAKGNAKSAVQIQHNKLDSKAAAARVKGEWEQRLKALEGFLSDSG